VAQVLPDSKYTTCCQAALKPSTVLPTEAGLPTAVLLFLAIRLQVLQVVHGS
jgi:hypothetical protein